MSGTKKFILFIIFIALLVGISAPFQNVSQPIYWGFLPAPIFYLLIFHLLFVAFMGYMVFFTRTHGRVEDEEKYLAEVRSQKEVKK